MQRLLTPQALSKYIYLSPPLIFSTTSTELGQKTAQCESLRAVLHYVEWDRIVTIAGSKSGLRATLSYLLHFMNMYTKKCRPIWQYRLYMLVVLIDIFVIKLFSYDLEVHTFILHTPAYTRQTLVSLKKYMPPPLPYFKVNICPLPPPHFASIFFAYL